MFLLPLTLVSDDTLFGEGRFDLWIFGDLSQTGLCLLSQRLLWIYWSIICSCFCSLRSNAWAPCVWGDVVVRHLLVLVVVGIPYLALGWNVLRAPFAPSLDYRSSESSLAVQPRALVSSNCVLPIPPNIRL